MSENSLCTDARMALYSAALAKVPCVSLGRIRDLCHIRTLIVTVSTVRSLWLSLWLHPTFDKRTGNFRASCIYPLYAVFLTSFTCVSVKEMLKMTSIVTCMVCMPSVWSSPGTRSFKTSDKYHVLHPKLKGVVWNNARAPFGASHIQFTPPTKSFNPDPLWQRTVFNPAACQISSTGSQCCVSSYCWSLADNRTNSHIGEWWRLSSLKVLTSYLRLNTGC